jgi:hypothetical protein
MRHILPWVMAAAVLALPRPAAADESVTANDLVKLAAAGLGDDILVALIESHDTVFKLSAADILALRERGLSQKVILAMLQTASKTKAAPAAATPAERPDLPPVALVPVEPTPPQPPVVVNVTQQVEQHVEAPRPGYSQVVQVPVAVAVPVYVRPQHPVRKPEPVYWGFGGQRRPDTWRDPRPNGGKDKNR